MSTPSRGSQHDVLQKLEELRNADQGANSQRHFKRYVVRGEAELRPIQHTQTNYPPIEIKIRDVGRGGVGFIADRHVAENTLWQACLIREGYVTTTHAIVIRHCRGIAENLYLIGGQVVAPTSFLMAMGVDPTRLREDETPGNRASKDSVFLPPSEVM